MVQKLYKKEEKANKCKYLIINNLVQNSKNRLLKLDYKNRLL